MPMPFGITSGLDGGRRMVRVASPADQHSPYRITAEKPGLLDVGA